MGHAAAAAIVLVVLFGAASVVGRPTAAGADPLRPVPGVAAPSASAGLTVNVTWDGAPISQAGSVGTAFSVTPTENASVNFTYVGGTANTSVAEVQLVLRYAGLALSTASSLTTGNVSNGSANIGWSFGSLAGIAQGAYSIDARAVNDSGAVVWSQSFFIDVKAPYGIGSAIALFATVLILAEAAWIATLLHARRTRRRRYRPR